MVVTLGQECNIRKKPTVMLYTYNNRHAGTPDKNKDKIALGLGSDTCHHYYITMLSAINKLQIDKAGGKAFFLFVRMESTLYLFLPDGVFYPQGYL